MRKIYVKLLFILCLCMSFLFLKYETYTYTPSQTESKEKIRNQSKEYKVEVKTKNEVTTIPLEEYLIGVLSGEMPVSFEEEALKAQAVASRTFVLSRNLKVDNTTNTQVYLSDQERKKEWKSKYQEYTKKLEKAVNETKGEVMTYQGKYISALFFSSSNGHTVNSEDYFSNQVSYLKSVDSHWDLTIDPHHTKTKVFTKKELARIFQVSSIQMNITSYTKSGYVKSVVVNDKEYTGKEIREKLNLASSCFQVELTSKGYKFTTHGSGHGVGMSQYGAQAMALEGKDYKEILHHYYQNVQIESIES